MQITLTGGPPLYDLLPVLLVDLNLVLLEYCSSASSTSRIRFLNCERTSRRIIRIMHRRRHRTGDSLNYLVPGIFESAAFWHIRILTRVYISDTY